MSDSGFGTRLLFTGLLMIAVGIALAVTEVLGGHALGNRFSLTIGGGDLAVAAVGWFLERREPDE